MQQNQYSCYRIPIKQWESQRLILTGWFIENLIIVEEKMKNEEKS